MEDIHIMLYQVNIASHHIRDRHVGFLFAWHGMEKHMSCYFLF